VKHEYKRKWKRSSLVSVGDCVASRIDIYQTRGSPIAVGHRKRSCLTDNCALIGASKRTIAIMSRPCPNNCTFRNLYTKTNLATILMTSLMQFSRSRLMSGFPQGPRFPNDCYGHPEIEQYVPDRESPLKRAVQDSIYVVPSIVSTQILERPQEPPLGWSSSSPLVAYTPGIYGSSLAAQCPNIASSSKPITYAIPNIGRSSSIQIHRKHECQTRTAKGSHQFIQFGSDILQPIYSALGSNIGPTMT